MKGVQVFIVHVSVILSSAFPAVVDVSCGCGKYEKLVSHTQEVVEEFLKQLPLDEGLWPDSIRVFIAESKTRYDELTGSVLPDWSNGVTIFPSRVIVVKAPDVAGLKLREYERVVRHEVVHLIHGCIAPLNVFPLWFVEGMAEYFSGGVSIRAKIDIAKAIIARSLIPLDKLVGFLTMNYYEVRLAYSEAASLIEFLVHSYGLDVPWEVVLRTGKTRDFFKAMEEITALLPGEVEPMWMSYLNRYYKKMVFLDTGRFVWILTPFLLFIAYIVVKLRNKIVKLGWNDVKPEGYEKDSDIHFPDC